MEMTALHGSHKLHSLETETLNQCWLNVGRRLRRRPNIELTLVQYLDREKSVKVMTSPSVPH